MQYVRNISDSVSTAWNSINPATLSGAIDVIVVEHADGTLACSPFHVRFGKFSLLRPYEKKVEFRVNGAKQEYSMKLGEGGEAFFVFETTETIPESMQTSPLVSPASSPPLGPDESVSQLGLPDQFALDGDSPVGRRASDDHLLDENGTLRSLHRSANLLTQHQSQDIPLPRRLPSTCRIPDQLPAIGLPRLPVLAAKISCALPPAQLNETQAKLLSEALSGLGAHPLSTSKKPSNVPRRYPADFLRSTFPVKLPRLVILCWT